MQMDFQSLFTPALLSVIFVFFLVDLFDSTGTMIGVAHRAGLLNEKGELPRLNRALLAVSSAIVAGSALGTSSVTAYVESAAGVAAGRRVHLDLHRRQSPAALQTHHYNLYARKHHLRATR